VVQAYENGQMHRVPFAAAEVGDGPTVAVEVEIITCLLVECRLGGTSVVHPQYYLPKVLTWPSSSSSPVHPSKLGRHPLGQLCHSQGH
jgi:hypothetical protein